MPFKDYSKDDRKLLITLSAAIAGIIFLMIARYAKLDNDTASYVFYGLGAVSFAAAIILFIQKMREPSGWHAIK